ncbi:MAG TPA: hypothetical protein VK745_21775 [Polyangiaceae bacterium]|jgi:hypothetical protein|nr:hypothetical protein [Polyangiaceae bacterium]
MPGDSSFDLLWTELLLRKGCAVSVVPVLVNELANSELLELARGQYLEAYATAFAAIHAAWRLDTKPQLKQIWAPLTPAMAPVATAFGTAVAQWLDDGGAEHFAQIPTVADLLIDKRRNGVIRSVEKGLLFAVDDDVGWAGQKRRGVEQSAARAFTPMRPMSSIAASVRKARTTRASIGLSRAVIAREGHGLSQQRVRRTMLFGVLRPLHPPAVGEARKMLRWAAVAAAPSKKAPRKILKEGGLAASQSELEALMPAQLAAVVSSIVPKPRGRAAPTREILLGLCLALHLDTAWDSSRFRELGRVSGKTVLERVRSWQAAGVWDAVLAAFAAAGVALNDERVQAKRLRRPRRRVNR